ncbi:hypothetical protein TSMEX_001298 [Taenia solium]|eukprot:TsM_000418700 transcript=TsM_000418700 gene=TsM_000418700
MGFCIRDMAWGSFTSRLGGPASRNANCALIQFLCRQGTRVKLFLSLVPLECFVKSCKSYCSIRMAITPKCLYDTLIVLCSLCAVFLSPTQELTVTMSVTGNQIIST